MDRAPSGLARKLLEIVAQETKRGVETVNQWAVLGSLAGPVRKENQDRLIAAQFYSDSARSFRTVALSDGMGGLPFGKEAASIALSSFVWSLCNSYGPVEERVKRAANYANEAVHSEFNGNSGATLSAVVVTRDGGIAAVNIGDSRIYATNSMFENLTQISTDDTLAGLAERGAAIDSRHNPTALLQYIGIGGELEISDIDYSRLSGHSSVIITSDGIHWIGNKILDLVVKNCSDHLQIARRLMQLAEITGAPDNASVAIFSDLRADGLTNRNVSGTFELEIFSPLGKATFLMQPFSPHHPKWEAREADYELDRQILDQPAKRTKRRKSPKKRPESKQPTLPMDQAGGPSTPERPIPIVQFGEPKSEEDETS